MANKKREVKSRRTHHVQKNFPLGVNLIRTLRGHSDYVRRIAWSPDGRLLASPSHDKTIRIWNIETGECLHTLRGHNGDVNCVAFDSIGGTLVSGSDDGTVKLWDVASGRMLRILVENKMLVWNVAFDATGRKVSVAGPEKVFRVYDSTTGNLVDIFEGHRNDVTCVVFDNVEGRMASGSRDVIKLWNIAEKRLLSSFEGRQGNIKNLMFDPSGQLLASGGEDKTVKLWEAATGRLLRTLEGHTGEVVGISFSSDGRCLASNSKDGSFRLWRVDNGDCLVVVLGPPMGIWPCGFAFNPSRPLLATIGSDLDNALTENVIHLYGLDFDLLFGQEAEASAHYVNAKVVLVGDTGVGKSGLSLVLNNQAFEATESTPGRRVWMLGSAEARTTDNVLQTRETLLWDLAGQPGYRVIHQLYLNEVAVALVVFDARSETDPLAGVRHWERALRLAHQRQGIGGIPMKKFLVSARNDRGGVSIGEDRLQAILKEFGFDGYFKTSAKEGWQISELRTSIEQAIPWEILPEVSSSRLFAYIKEFLIKVKETGQLLALPEQLYANFVAQHSTAGNNIDLRAQFETCIGRLEARDLIRRLTFGGYVLLQPELLDAYASAMVNTAKEEPDGLGSLAEEIALIGKFFVPKEQKITDAGQEQLLLHATVEELVRHDLALRENADDGRYLVFPSQFNRDYEDAPEPKGKAAAITFDGPVQSLYATLAVRLGHSGLFTTGRAEMWRNAAVFTAKAGGKCGLFVNEFSEGRARLVLFYDEHASVETRYHFEEYVIAHATRRSLKDSVMLVRFFVCANGHPVPDDYVNLLRAHGKNEFDCPCGMKVLLAEPKDRLRFKSVVEAMDKSADRQRDFDAFVMSAKGETSTAHFTAWAGENRLTLAIVFTDVLGSTQLGNEIGDTEMNKVRRAHFEQSRKLIAQHQGREVKTIGDSFMAAFKCVGKALDYAKALQHRTGHERVLVRAGIHIGPVGVEENDVFGGAVNFAARVVGAIKGAEIWLSDRAKVDLDALAAEEHTSLKWERHDGVEMKGFTEKATLWSLKKEFK